eukprot:c2563_g1_i1.p1 GENE.c2563_g1_i1~~c2563_g1_i1.p1  ORF type:complete len:287 (+),score=85.25 c2563_g1_i1:71-931(+)
MRVDPKEVSQKFLNVVNSRSGGGIIGLARNFKIIDKDGSGALSLPEFTIAMQKFRVPLGVDEIEALFHYYDRDHSGSVNFDEFLKGLRSQLSEQRRELTEQAFVKFDTDGSGKIDVNDLKDKYDTSKHPKVMTGQMTKEEAINEFIKIFEGDNGNGDAIITLEEWMDYHAGLSSNIDTDDQFGMMMASNWGIAYIPQSRLDAIKSMIREKAEQKGKGNPMRTAQAAFKHFDLDNSGALEYGEFKKAMETFGAFLAEDELKTFFGIFDKDNSGAVSYQEIVDAVWEK